MGNNIYLKYDDISAVVYNFNLADQSLEEARKILGESTDWGSSLMQKTWSFGNKEAIFGAVKSARKNMKNEIDENKKLINLLNKVSDMYESAGKNTSSSIWNKKLFAKIAKLGFLTYALVNPTLFASLITLYSARQIVSYINSSSTPKLTTSLSTNVSNGVTSLKESILGSSTAADNSKKDAGLSGTSTEAVNTNVSTVTASENSTASTISTDMDVKAGQCLSDIWQNWGAVSPNGFTNYNGKGNCTWYADNRWSQVNPNNPLVFNGRGGNAKNWINSIDKSKFNVLSTSDTNNIKGNAIAVSQSGTYGHVAYIENVKDGMVYYTEDGESYTRPHTWQKDSNGNWIGPTVQSCTLEQFKLKFGNIITSK